MNNWRVLKNNGLRAQNYVGIIETRKRNSDAWLNAMGLADDWLH